MIDNAKKAIIDIEQAEAYEDWLRQRPYDRIFREPYERPRYVVTGHGSRRLKLRIR